MKTNSLLGLLAAFTLAGTQITQAAEHPLVTVKEAQWGSYSSRLLPKGFTDKKLYRRPKMTKEFVAYLDRLEKEAAAQWEKYVLESDEFEHLTEEKRKEAAKDPKGELGVRYLVEIHEVYQIFQNGESVGYCYSTAEHVQAAIIQDGSGLEIYVDNDLKVIATDHWDA